MGLVGQAARAASSRPAFIWKGLIPPGSQGPTDPAATAASDFGRIRNRARTSAQVRSATANQSMRRKSMLSDPVSQSWHRAPRRMASARRTAMSGLAERWPGEASNSPAPVAR